MHIRLNQEFPYSLERVLQARERRYENMHHYPELQNQQLLEEKIENGIKFRRRKLDIGERIPEVVKTILPKKMLDIIEESHYDLEQNVNKFDIFAKGNKDKFHIKGETHYRDLGDQRSSRDFAIVIRVNVPLVGKMVAQQVGASYERGLIKDYENLMQMLEETEVKP